METAAIRNQNYGGELLTHATEQKTTIEHLNKFSLYYNLSICFAKSERDEHEHQY